MAPRVASVLLALVSLSHTGSAFQPSSRAGRVRNLSHILTSSSEEYPVPNLDLSGRSNPPKPKPLPTKGDGLYAPAFVGLAQDMRLKSKTYSSDWTDGLQLQTVAVVPFLFFACIAPAVAFGSLIAPATNGAIGTVEYLLGTGLSGMIYALFSAQPMTIIGSTGPVLAFTAVLYEATTRIGLPFLPIYAWVGLWSSLFLFLGSIFSLSNITSRLTKFTDETFSMLISLIFITEAVKECRFLFLTPGISFETASGSLILSVTAFFLATTLSKLRSSQFFNNTIRENVSNFAPTLGILAAWKLGTVFRDMGVHLSGLQMPLTFATTSGRPWLVDIFAVPMWARLAAVVPAIMSTILLFMDQNITARLVNSEKNKLRKGYGYDLDLFVIAALTAASSLVGLPWLVAATVRSLAHVRANAIYDPNVPGRVVGLREQRVTAFVVHAMILIAVLLFRPVLSTLPASVMTGIFLFLGVSSLRGIEFWERTKLLLTDPEREPNSKFRNRVPRQVVKDFTTIQLACLFGMIAVKEGPMGIFFPVLIALLGPVRNMLSRKAYFKPHMNVLD